METKQRFITMFIALVAMFMGTKVMAQEVNPGFELVQEIDWTQQDSYYNGVWYSYPNCIIAVNRGEGLVITSNPPENAQISDAQVPIIAKIPEISAGEYYQVKFTVDAPAAGEIRLDFCSWDGSGANMAANIDVEKGLKEYTADFINYPTSCTNAMVFYQCGKMPGKHTIKKVQVWRKVLRAYAVLSDDGKTLTFYCDGNKSTYEPSNVYDLNEGNSAPEWIQNTSIETVAFDETFASARPVSTYSWFNGLTSLGSIVNIENLNTSEVTTMNHMFFGCSSLTSVTLSGFNTSNVESTSFMFSGCHSLTSLDLSSFNTTNMRYMNSMFNACENLKTITVGELWNTANVEASGKMFSNCTSLVGGAGTKYNSGKLDKEYARIDGGTSNPGYLTALTYNLKLAGVRVTAANQNNVLGNGIFTYVPSSKTLKVKGSYSSSLDVPLIESHIDGLIIDVMQDAVLEASSTHGNQVFWLKDGTTTMKGMGKLTLKSLYETGIYLTNSASVVIDNMNMVIDAYWGIAGPPSGQKQEKLTIKSSNIVITTGSSTSNDLAAICDLRGGIILQDCSITSPNGYNISNGSVYNNGKLAREVTITVDGGISTDIDAIDNGQLTIDKSLPLYNLNGQRVSHPVKGQIYIQNGRKIKF